MPTNDGLIISDTTPTDAVTGFHSWLKINGDGSREWYELTHTGIWSLVKTEDAPAAADHTHATHGDIDFTGNISAGGYAGHNGRETVGDKKLTFKEGICILVEDA